MENLSIRGITMATVNASLAAGTGTTVSTTGVMRYCINGKAYSVNAITNGAVPTVDVNTGTAFKGVEAGKGSVFVFGFNAAGQMRVAQGSIEDLDGDGNLTVAPSFPDIPDDFCPIAYQMVKAGDAASTWTFGQSNQASVTGVTFTRQDVMTLPAAPQLS